MGEQGDSTMASLAGLQPRRSKLFATLGGLIIGALLTTFPAVHALATSGGSAYTVPALVDTNPAAHILEATLIADEATVNIGSGGMANAQTYNGQIPGPEFRLKVGDTVIVHFENRLDKQTGIHWHGIELTNASDGTPLTQNQVP